MKAVMVREFGPIGSTSVEEVAMPSPHEGELLIDVAFAPVNFVDTLVLQGTYQFLPPLPFTPGKGPVGTVRAVGAGVEGFNPGDRVLAMAEQGGYAQAACVRADQCYRLPDTLSFEDAASMSLAYDTAWFALVERARIRPGERVLVLGATGAVGHAAIQLAKAKGATVLAAVSSPKKAASVIEAGADHVVDLSQPDLRDSLRRQVHEALDGQGVDIVIDPVGGDIFAAAIRALAWRGRLVVVGFAAGDIPVLKVNYVLLKNIEVSGLQISDYRKRMPEMVRDCFEDMFRLHAEGKLKPSPIAAFALEDHVAALKGLLDRSVSGRIVLKP